MIHQHFQATGTLETVLDVSGLMSVTLRGDDVQGFDTRWDGVLLLTEDVLAGKILDVDTRVSATQHRTGNDNE